MRDRAHLFKVLLAVFVTAVVYVDLWNGRLPTVSTVGVLGAVAAGIVVGSVEAYRSVSLETARVSRRTVVLLVVVAVVVAARFFPEGIPAPALLALVVTAWVDALVGYCYDRVSTA
ncbi:hypothetical protein [Halopiger goleimassiliensis]|uniref:hypothetical protein n=1 Tax=Halopiger goleimassiliensis TaxID=1293048 RepID=UPI00067808CF|nr:hypothetical protein [Halopiger goleimassiliensis]